jgi:peptide/nickel transport system ATP-binding protein
MLEVKDLSKVFYSGLLKKNANYAVNKFSFKLQKGEIVGLVGPSGCGKSTVARLILRLLEPSGGAVFFNDIEISALSRKSFRHYRKRIQIIFQHPQSSLNPKIRIYDTLKEPLKLFGLVDNQKEEKEKIAELLDMVNLPDELLSRYPEQLSGGQLQRVTLARVLSLEPELIVADEPTSMLDISIQAQIIKLLKGLQQKKNLSILFISHDEVLVKAFCNRYISM